MRPKSIVNFERFYLGAFALGLVNAAVGWDMSVAALRTASVPGLEFGPVWLVVGLAIGALITLLLWYFAARRASVVAKWLIVVFFGFGLLGWVQTVMLGGFAQGLTSPVTFGLSTISMILQALAVWMLFRSDARLWFDGEDEADAAVFS